MALNALLDACLRGNDDFSFCHSTRFLHQLELGNTSLFLKGQSIWDVLRKCETNWEYITIIYFFGLSFIIFYNMLILYLFLQHIHVGVSLCVIFCIVFFSTKSKLVGNVISFDVIIRTNRSKKSNTLTITKIFYYI